jgi:hypothetical protein
MEPRKSRLTGSMIEIKSAEEYGDTSDPEFKWVLLCWTHRNASRTTTKKTALTWVAHSDHWCKDCVAA